MNTFMLKFDHRKPGPNETVAEALTSAHAVVTVIVKIEDGHYMTVQVLYDGTVLTKHGEDK